MSSFVVYGPGFWVEKQLKEAKETRCLSAKYFEHSYQNNPSACDKECHVLFGQLGASVCHLRYLSQATGRTPCDVDKERSFARIDKFEQWLMTVHLMWFGSTQEEQP